MSEQTEWEQPDAESLAAYYVSRIAFIIAVGDPEELKANRMEYEMQLERLNQLIIEEKL